MSIKTLQEVLLWCSIINLGMFFLSFIIFRFAHDWIYKYRGKWYKISEEKFDVSYYTVMQFYKTCILFFNIVPYVALRLVG